MTYFTAPHITLFVKYERQSMSNLVTLGEIRSVEKVKLNFYLYCTRNTIFNYIGLAKSTRSDVLYVRDSVTHEVNLCKNYVLSEEN